MRSIRDHCTTFIKRYKSKTRREVKRTALWREGFSKNEQLLEDLVERFEESERRPQADTQKRQSYIEIEKNKAQEMGQKAKERFGETRKPK